MSDGDGGGKCPLQPPSAAPAAPAPAPAPPKAPNALANLLEAPPQRIVRAESSPLMLNIHAGAGSPATHGVSSQSQSALDLSASVSGGSDGSGRLPRSLRRRGSTLAQRSLSQSLLRGGGGGIVRARSSDTLAQTLSHATHTTAAADRGSAGDTRSPVAPEDSLDFDARRVSSGSLPAHGGDQADPAAAGVAAPQDILPPGARNDAPMVLSPQMESETNSLPPSRGSVGFADVGHDPERSPGAMVPRRYSMHLKRRASALGQRRQSLPRGTGPIRRHSSDASVALTPTDLHAGPALAAAPPTTAPAPVDDTPDPIRTAAMLYLHSMLQLKDARPMWRQRLDRFVRSEPFDDFILACIAINCIFLAIVDPTDSDNSSNTNKAAYYAEIVFTVIFTLEMALRIAGQGFVHTPSAYLRDPWNRLDFVIVLSGIASLLLDVLYDQQGGAVNGLRAFRLFKPLRAVTKVREVQVIVNSLLQSLPQLVDVLLLSAFFLVIMGIVAVQMWKEDLSYTCMPVASLAYPLLNSSLDALGYDGTSPPQPRPPPPLGGAGGGGLNTSLGGGPRYSLGGVYDHLDAAAYAAYGATCSPHATHFNGYHCPFGFECVDTGNPWDGKVAFDNLGVALLTLFTVMTLEGWSDIMYTTFDASGRLSCIFFVVCIAFGSFFIVNLSLVIINQAFVRNVEMQNEQRRFYEQRASPPPVAEADGDGTGTYTASPPSRPGGLSRSNSSDGAMQLHPSPATEQLYLDAAAGDGSCGHEDVKSATTADARRDSLSLAPAQAGKTFVDNTDDGTGAGGGGGGGVPPSGPDEPACSSKPDPPVPPPPHTRRHGSSPMLAAMRSPPRGMSRLSHSSGAHSHHTDVTRHRTSLDPPAVGSLSPSLPLPPAARRARHPVRVRAERIVTSKAVVILVTAAVVANCVILGAQFHGQPQAMTDVTYYCSLAFTGLYMLESVLKLVAYPPEEFVRDGHNILELAIAITGVLDLFVKGFAVLTSLRLLRLFRLAHMFPDFWRFIIAIAHSVKGVAVLTLLLGIVLFIYALLGMSLFGGKYCELRTSGYADAPDASCPHLPRENFDNLWSALLSVFQVITGEDWNVLMYDAMRATNDAACLYFVSLFVIGNYIVLNLFIAVLLEGLDSADDDALADDAVYDPAADEFVTTAEAHLALRKLSERIAAGGGDAVAEAQELPASDGMTVPCDAIAAPDTAVVAEREPAGPPDCPAPPLPAAAVPVAGAATRPSAGGAKASPRLEALQREPSGSVAAVTAAVRFLGRDASNATLEASVRTPDSAKLLRDASSFLAEGKPQQSGSMRLVKSPSGHKLGTQQSMRANRFRDKRVEVAGDAAEPTTPKRAATASPRRHRRTNDVAAAFAGVLEARPDTTPMYPAAGPAAGEGDSSQSSCFPSPPPRGQGGHTSDLMYDSPSPATTIAAASPLTYGSPYSPAMPDGCTGFNSPDAVSPAGPVAQQPKRRASFVGVGDLQSMSRKNSVETTPPRNPLQPGGHAGALACGAEDGGEEPRGHVPLPRPSGLLLSRVASPRRCAGSGDELTTSPLPHVESGVSPAAQADPSCAGRARRTLRDLTRNPDALWLLTPANPLRRGCCWAVETTVFEFLVILMILASTVCLAIERPLDPPDSRMTRALETSAMVLAFAFTAEAVLRILAHGFVLHRDSYLRRDAWNVLDFLIVVAGLVDVGLNLSRGDSGGGSEQRDLLEIFRMFRILRPLRFINKSPGLKRVVDSLLNSIKGLSHVVAVTLMVFISLGIMGMQFFMSRFHACSYAEWGDVTRGLACPHADGNCTAPYPSTQADCDAHEGYRWEAYPSNFDNLGRALVSLFEIATLEGWVAVMHVGIDSHLLSSKTDQEAPTLNHQPWVALYFVFVIVVLSFFLVNLFVGVLLAEYDMAGQDDADAAALTDAQAEWRLVLALVTNNTKPMEDDMRLLSICEIRLRALVTHRGFEVFISSCIALNAAVMCTEHARQSDDVAQIIAVSSYVFIAVFTLEALLKIIVYRRAYFLEKWNRFDFVIVCISLAGILLSETLSFRPVLSVLRVLRLARLLRLARMTKGVRMLLRTLFLSVPGLVNVGALLALLFTLYAIMGVKFFGRVAKDNNALNNYANFDNFIHAVLLLFRMCTGEAWHLVMLDTRAEPPRCSEHLDTCGNPVLSWLYFLSFLVLGMFIMLNLIVAIILKEFTTATEEEAGLFTTEDVSGFSYHWERFDHARTGFMYATQLRTLLCALGPPLGGHEYGSGAPVYELAARLRNYDGCVYYKEVLLTCIRRLIAHEACEPMEAMDLPFDMMGPIDAKLDTIFPPQALAARKILDDTSICEVVAAVRVQALYRGWCVRRRWQQTNKAAARTSIASPVPSAVSIDLTSPQIIPASRSNSGEAPPVSPRLARVVGSLQGTQKALRKWMLRIGKTLSDAPAPAAATSHPPPARDKLSPLVQAADLAAEATDGKEPRTPTSPAILCAVESAYAQWKCTVGKGRHMRRDFDRHKGPQAAQAQLQRTRPPSRGSESPSDTSHGLRMRSGGSPEPAMEVLSPQSRTSGDSNVCSPLQPHQLSPAAPLEPNA